MNVKDRHQAYRGNIQKYSKEEQGGGKICGTGYLSGTEKFVKKIKMRYLPDKPHAELPHQKRVMNDVKIEIEYFQGQPIY